MFHRGAEIPGKHPRLVGGGGTVKYMYLADVPDVDAQRSAIEAVIRAWCEMRGISRAAKSNTRAAGSNVKGAAQKKPESRTKSSRATPRKGARKKTP